MNSSLAGSLQSTFTKDNIIFMLDREKEEKTNKSMTKKEDKTKRKGNKGKPSKEH